LQLSLLTVSARSKKADVFSYFTKVKGKYLARSQTISLNKGLFNTYSHLC